MNTPAPAPTVRIAIVGDVHNQWDQGDAIALQQLGVDLALFVGDFGNEAVAVVEQIAALELPKAVVFGNHDAWYSATSWGRKQCPYNRDQEDWVQRQLDLVGEAHVGYGYRDFPQLQLSVVGGRPFSWGGPTWRQKRFYRERFGVTGMESSRGRIVAAVDGASCQRILFLSHCGPVGLGASPESICGRDWKPTGGDYGDPDLAAAIVHARQRHSVPLVAFGHMHHGLRHRQDRLRQCLVSDPQGTTYLNAARVPRWRSSESGRLSNFSVVTLGGARVETAALVWVGPAGIVSQTPLQPEGMAEVGEKMMGAAQG